MPRMTMREFIRSHRREIDDYVRTAINQPRLRLNDSEREDWICNDTTLHLWARQLGVRSINL